MVRPAAYLVSLALAGLALVGPAAAQSSKEPPVAQARLMLNAAQDNWVAFRNWAGKQLVYFTNVQAYHCNLEEIRYSINSTDLDGRLPVAPCDEQDPYAVRDVEYIFIELPPGTAQSLAIQVLWKDGVASPVNVFVPCDNAGDSTCGASKP